VTSNLDTLTLIKKIEPWIPEGKKCLVNAKSLHVAQLALKGPIIFSDYAAAMLGILFLREDDKFLNSIASRDPRNGTSIMQKIEIPPGIKMRMNV